MEKWKKHENQNENIELFNNGDTRPSIRKKVAMHVVKLTKESKVNILTRSQQKSLN